MTHPLPPYPASKESGVPWLGAIPAHWETRKLRNILSSVAERNRPDLPLLSVVREKGVILRDITTSDENHNYIPDDLTNYKVVRKGQFAMNKMKAWQGSYGVSSHDGIVSPAYYVFDVDGVDGRFFHAALRSRVYISFFGQASDGVRIGQWDLSKTRMREIPFFVPPLPEQTAIARYLDSVDGRIRRYIRAKRRLIEVLTEQKQAIIHQAVTRGLDLDVPMKESGVAWLGEIPAHWEVSRIGQVSRVVRGQTPRPAGDPRYFSGDALPWITVGEVTKDGNRYLTETATKLTWEGVKRSIIFDEGTLVLTNSGATLGVPKVLAISGCMNDGVAALLSIRTTVSRDYLYYFFQMSTRHLREVTKIGGQPNLNIGIISNLQLPIPSLIEQTEVCEYLDAVMMNIAAAIARTHGEIDLIREYRTRLIADVVTGKVDVRVAAASLSAALGSETEEGVEDVWEEEEEGEDDGSTPDEGGDNV